MSTLTDRALLELAARAAGIPVPKQDPQGWCGVDPKGLGVFFMNCDGTKPESQWNPLTDDGDAFRLAVKLGMRISTDSGSGDRKMTEVLKGYGLWAVEHGRAELHGDDPLAATRRAIVRAAAEIGRSMK